MTEPADADEPPTSMQELEILLKLSEQVAEIEARLSRIESLVRADEQGNDDGSVFSFSTAEAAPAKSDPLHVQFGRQSRPPLPDPRLIRSIIRHRQLRRKFFDGNLFADPAWDILLDLTAARVEHSRVSVTSLCIASGVPATTALRWITLLTKAGLIERMEDEIDRRRAFVAITDKGANAMARLFAARSGQV